MILLSLVNKTLAKILLWKEVYAERKELSNMSDDLLKDIGISRAEANHEANRHFWDASPFKEARR